ncbi:efflux RND transporter periplasmic adaptor subunit [Paracoccus sp. Z330]|uniref:Efflux RND transporter periplasmic adaptor subunit n=1 Tax=Paracoccus onchidii TaxID=3017813 RepID=A0ABT4ZAE0_9RHOB|nr:efflux RND transporter periplasmic adaptor subunit [Paracoccus onchidii]MDB6176323.1 efflux RND transporter periplasmic adaptor subunit [Paracoccus onchidii]
MRLSAAFVLCALVLSPLSAAYGQDIRDEAPIRPAKLMVLERSDDVMHRRFFGRVTARNTVNLSFRAGGQIEELPVREGEFVRAGDVLGKLDPAPFERAVRETKAQLDQTERQLKRLSELGAGIVPQADIDDARTARDVAQVGYDDAIDSLEDATLVAPFDALISQRVADRFATIAAGEPIVRAHDMSEVQIEIKAPEILFRKFGEQPVFSANAQLSHDGPLYPLEFREFTAEATEVGQSYLVTFAVMAETPDYLLPGSSATVLTDISRGDGNGVLILPASALRFTPEGGAQVLVFQPDDGSEDIGTLQAHDVEIEPADGTRFRMLKGPEVGATIVAAGASMLADKARVRRFEGLSGDGGQP